MDIEKIALAAIPVILGVIAAGFIMSALGGTGGLLASAQVGYTGGN